MFNGILNGITIFHLQHITINIIMSLKTRIVLVPVQVLLKVVQHPFYYYYLLVVLASPIPSSYPPDKLHSICANEMFLVWSLPLNVKLSSDHCHLVQPPCVILLLLPCLLLLTNTHIHSSVCNINLHTTLSFQLVSTNWPVTFGFSARHVIVFPSSSMVGTKLISDRVVFTSITSSCERMETGQFRATG